MSRGKTNYFVKYDNIPIKQALDSVKITTMSAQIIGELTLKILEQYHEWLYQQLDE